MAKKALRFPESMFVTVIEGMDGEEIYSAYPDMEEIPKDELDRVAFYAISEVGSVHQPERSYKPLPKVRR